LQLIRRIGVGLYLLGMGTTLLTFTLLALSAVPVWATAIGPATVALGLLLCVTNVRPDSQPVASEND
jgi:predicted exporter